MEKYSRHQQQIIKNYYNNREDVALQRVQELVTELFLAEGKQREKVWKNLTTHLEKLGVSAERIATLRKQDKPELVLKQIEAKLNA